MLRGPRRGCQGGVSPPTLPAMTRRSALVPARRLRHRRLPGRPRADDHGRRPAVDPRRPRDPDRSAAGLLELRHASWIVNGYLLAYILTMPLAGRLADVWGARRLFLGRAGRLHRRLARWPGGPDARRADRRAARPGASAAASSCPVGTAAASHLFEGARPAAGARGHRGADVPRDGRRAVPRRRDPRRAPRRRTRSAARSADGTAAPRRPHAGLALGLLRQRPDRARSRCSSRWAASRGWDTPRRAGPASTVAAPRGSASRWLPGSSRLDAHRRDSTSAGPAIRAGRVTALLLARRDRRRRSSRSSAASGSPTRSSTRGCSGADFTSAALVSLLTGYAFATAIIGGAVFVDRVLYGGPDQQRLALGALAGATAVGALVSGFAVRVLSLRLVTLVGLALAIAGLSRCRRGRPATPSSRSRCRWRLRAGVRADRHATLHRRGRGGRAGASSGRRRRS